MQYRDPYFIPYKNDVSGETLPAHIYDGQHATDLVKFQVMYERHHWKKYTPTEAERVYGRMDLGYITNTNSGVIVSVLQPRSRPFSSLAPQPAEYIVVKP